MCQSKFKKLSRTLVTLFKVWSDVYVCLHWTYVTCIFMLVECLELQQPQSACNATFSLTHITVVHAHPVHTLLALTPYVHAHPLHFISISHTLYMCTCETYCYGYCVYQWNVAIHVAAISGSVPNCIYLWLYTKQQSHFKASLLLCRSLLSVSHSVSASLPSPILMMCFSTYNACM